MRAAAPFPDKEALPELSISPNPTTGQLQLRASGQKWEGVRLLSPAGQILLQRRGYFAETLELDLSGYPADLYWLQVESGGNG